jgi:phosphoribosylformylglycinamidine cyclo-ligase
MGEQRAGLTYTAAGVDVEAGDRAVELMRASVARSHGPQVLGGLGGFAGMYDAAELSAMRRPVLVTSTDGVGTKVALAQAMDRHDSIGQDLVAMVVDDIVVTGARPLFMTDYIACGRVVPERIASIVTGIANACAATGTALVGGETAEHPGLLGVDEYDLAGAATGVVERDAVLGPHRVRPGDEVVAMASSGVHSNGYSLVRRVVQDVGWSWERHVPELGGSLGDALLEPTRLYTATCLDVASCAQVHAFSHVTGGGLAANLARVLPRGLHVDVRRDTWSLPAIMTLLADLGRIAQPDLERTLNLGIGMVALVAPDETDTVIARCESHGIAAWQCGQVTGDAANARHDGSANRAKGVDGGTVALVGRYLA